MRIAQLIVIADIFHILEQAIWQTIKLNLITVDLSAHINDLSVVAESESVCVVLHQGHIILGHVAIVLFDLHKTLIELVWLHLTT